jgi:hypothetical protein
MKKLILFLIIMSPIYTNATEINSMYMDSEMDIAGNLIIKEVIEIDNYNENLKLNLFYKDSSRNKFDGTKTSFYMSDIYNASRININYIGIVDENSNISDMYNSNFVKDKLSLIKDYNKKDENGYLKLELEKTNKKTTYYIEYLVIGAAVKHNDCSEMYYKYLSEVDYNIKNITILFKLPFNSALFNVYVHSKQKIKTTKDEKSSIVLSEIENYEKNTDLEYRIAFDKDIYSLSINDDRKSNTDALNFIEKIEHERQNNVKIKKILTISLISCIVILIVSIISYMFYKKKKI